MEQLSSESELIQQLLSECSEKEEGGDLKSALSIAQEALARSKRANAVVFISQAQALLAKVMVRTGRYHDAASMARKILQREKDNRAAVDAWLIAGICRAEAGDLSAAEEQFHRAADISRLIGYSEGQRRSYHNLASSVHMPRGQFDLALNVMEESQRIGQQNGAGNWGLPFLQAYIYQITGSRKKARQALDDLLPLVKPSTRLAGAYFYLWARLAVDEGEMERAEQYLRLAMRIAAGCGAPDLNVWVRLEYSRFYRLSGDPANARSWSEDAVRYTERLGCLPLLGESLIENAECARLCGDPITAEALLLKAAAVLRPLPAAYHLARIDFMLAAWSQQLQKQDAEERWLQAAQAIQQGGYYFILEQERELAFPLAASYLKSRAPAARKSAETLLENLARTSPPPLKVIGLGEFKVWQGKRAVAESGWLRRKAGELFRFLLLQPHWSANREQILDALWPDHNAAAAVDLLHQSSSTLRHLLEPDLPDKFPSRYLQVEGERISLKLPEGSAVDFLDFQILLPTAMKSRRVVDVEKALALYRGELFPGDRYTDWTAAQREQLVELYLKGLLWLGNLYLGEGAYHEAVDCARQILVRDPWQEEAVLLGMQAYINLRDAPRAIGLYKDLEKVLADELDLAPREDLQQLAAKIRSRGLKII